MKASALPTTLSRWPPYLIIGTMNWNTGETKETHLRVLQCLSTEVFLGWSVKRNRFSLPRPC